MAIKKAIVNESSNRCFVFEWAEVAVGEECKPVEMPASSLRSVQFSGVMGIGGMVSFEGSNNGVDYVVLTDAQGNSLTKNSMGIEGVQELTKWVRPRVDKGDESTKINVTVFVGRGF